MDAMIKEGLTFLAASQQPDGSFFSDSSSSFIPFSSQCTYQTTFFTSLMLISLASLSDEPIAQAIAQNGVRFLQREKSPSWSFNYWARQSPESATRPYPDDLDDTALALMAIDLWNPDCLDGSAWAHIVQLLTACEVKEGGPYYTWLVPSSAPLVWRDIDFAVNCNLAAFLARHDIVLPGLMDFIEQAIHDGYYRSAYYPTFYSLIGFISRWYKGPFEGKLRHRLLEYQLSDGTWGTVLPTALAIMSWLQLGGDKPQVTKAVNFLVKSGQAKQWIAESFCLDPPQGKSQYYAGSATLTTALCLEAMASYKRADAPLVSRVTKIKRPNREEREYGSVWRRINKRLSHASLANQNDIKKIFGDLLQRPSMAQLVLVPWYTYSALLPELRQEVKGTCITDLCVATACGWVAYSLYDDCLDEASGLQRIPLANIALREMVGLFYGALNSHGEFMTQFQMTLDALEGANFREMTTCRAVVDKGVLFLPDVVIDPMAHEQLLVDRSFGHALGPLGILSLAGIPLDSPDAEQVKLFFRHYILARQLNDDAHDWVEDLKQGHLSPLVLRLLEGVKKKNQIKIVLTRSLPLCRTLFWETVSVEVGQSILDHSTAARAALAKTTCFSRPALLARLLIPLEKAAQDLLREQKQTHQFVNTFKKGDDHQAQR